MLQKSLANIIILLYLFQLINCQTKFYEPRRRFGHTAAVLDDNKLYMFGGYDMASSIDLLGKEFFYIDFSIPFNTKELTWEDLSDYYTLPSHAFSATVKGNRNNNTLFLYGGIIESTAETLLVYRYDTQSNAWSTPTITGINNIRKRDLIGIIDNNGKMYLWSGMKVINEKNTNYVNDMLILDTINLSWGQGSTIGAPTARGNYGAILLPNNNIIYMGK